jgi:Ca-activated chloride channel family protein
LHLKAVAQITEADYFKAGSADDLKQVYQYLSTPFKLEKRDTEISALLAGAALICLMLAQALSEYWFRMGASSSAFMANRPLIVRESSHE